MSYDFKTRVDRSKMGSMKWNQMYEWNPNTSENVIPMSVADMEFKQMPEIIDDLKAFLDDAVLGYTAATEPFLNAVVDWQKRRHNWDIEKEWIVNTQGVVSAFYAGVRAFSNEGDGVINFRPSYYPFGLAIEDTKRVEVNVPLLEDNGYYTIDFDGFENAAKDPNNKVLLFCSPHNPVGRVWKKEELIKLIDIALKHDVFIISDEIWYDFVMPGYEHTVLARLNQDIHKQLITCTAPSKSFNVAGMMTSNIIISDTNVREKFKRELESVRGDMIGILGYETCRICYTKGDEWLDELVELVDTNQHVVQDFFKENYPKIKAPLSEGTYLQWLDFRELGLTDEELEIFLHEEAEFFTDEGYVFGAEGSGYERVNLALPTDALVEALERLVSKLKEKFKS